MKALFAVCFASVASIAMAQPAQEDILITCKTLARLAHAHINTQDFDKIVLLHNAYLVAKSSLHDKSAVQEFDTFWERMRRYEYPVLAVEFDRYQALPPDWRHQVANPFAALPTPSSGASPSIPGWKHHEIRWFNEMTKAGLKLQDLEIKVETAKEIIPDKPLPTSEPDAKPHIKVETLGAILDSR